MSSDEVIRRLKNDGWFQLKRKGGSHKQFKHDTKPGKVTVQDGHKDLDINVLKSIEKQSGLKLI